MASSGNQHCANCIGTLSYRVGRAHSSQSAEDTERVCLGVSMTSFGDSLHAR